MYYRLLTTDQHTCTYDHVSNNMHGSLRKCAKKNSFTFCEIITCTPIQWWFTLYLGGALCCQLHQKTTLYLKRMTINKIVKYHHMISHHTQYYTHSNIIGSTSYPPPRPIFCNNHHTRYNVQCENYIHIHLSFNPKSTILDHLLCDAIVPLKH